MGEGLRGGSIDFLLNLELFGKEIRIVCCHFERINVAFLQAVLKIVRTNERHNFMTNFSR